MLLVTEDKLRTLLSDALIKKADDEDLEFYKEMIEEIIQKCKEYP